MRVPTPPAGRTIPRPHRGRPGPVLASPPSPHVRTVTRRPPAVFAVSCGLGRRGPPGSADLANPGHRPGASPGARLLTSPGSSARGYE